MRRFIDIHLSIGNFPGLARINSIPGQRSNSQFIGRWASHTGFRNVEQRAKTFDEVLEQAIRVFEESRQRSYLLSQMDVDKAHALEVVDSRIKLRIPLWASSEIKTVLMHIGFVELDSLNAVWELSRPCSVSAVRAVLHPLLEEGSRLKPEMDLACRVRALFHGSKLQFCVRQMDLFETFED